MRRKEKTKKILRTVAVAGILTEIHTMKFGSSQLYPRIKLRSSCGKSAEVSQVLADLLSEKKKILRIVTTFIQDNAKHESLFAFSRYYLGTHESCLGIP